MSAFGQATLAPLSQCRVTVTRCENPQCPSSDMRGPIDTRPKRGSFTVTRTWFCRRCWWTKELELFDDLEKAAADATRRPSSSARR